jgi:hypothetical protein
MGRDRLGLFCGVGQAINPCRYAMPESPLLFSSVAPACGFCLEVQSRSRGVQKQGQVGRWAGGQIVVEELDTNCRPQATDRRPEGGAGIPQLPDSSICLLQNRGNKARMFMKTKDKYKMSGSADRRVCGLRLFHDHWDGPGTANTAVRATPKSGEQSENVYENKG